MGISPNVVIEKCQQAGLSFWIASKAALDLKDRLDEKMGEREINRKISNMIRQYDGDAATQFDSYHSIEVRTSQDVLETFDREKITNSLIKETRVPKTIAEEIAQEVETDIRRLQLKNLSSPLIREMVNATLLQKKLSSAKTNYTRVGLPVYDIKNIIEKKRVQSPFLLNEMFGNEMLGEYALLKVLPKNISDAYLNSDIYIHALEDFVTTPFSLQNDFRLFLKHGFSMPGASTTAPAKRPEVAISHAVRVLLTSKDFIARGVGFDFFNIFIAPYIKDKSDKTVSQVCQAFFYELNRTITFDYAFTVNFDTEIPKFMLDMEAIGPGGKVVGKYGDYKEESRKFLKIFLEVMKKGDVTKKTFKWPSVCIKYNKVKKELDDLDLPRPCFFIKQKEKNQSLVYNHVIEGRENKGLRTGMMQAISVNLVKGAKLAKDDKDFYEKLAEVLDLTKQIALIKRDVLKDRLYKSKVLAFLGQFYGGEEYIKLDGFQNLVLLVGLPQACRLFLKKETYDKECMNLSERILRFTHRKFREYRREEGLNLCVGEGKEISALTKFISENKKLGIDVDVSSGLAPAEIEEDERLEIYKKLQPLFNGGAFLDTNDKSLLKSKDFSFLKIF